MKKNFAKAIEINDDFLPTGKFTLIELSEEELTKHRIVEELASMSLECDPLLNPKKDMGDMPIIFWSSEDLQDDENDKINEILETKTKEFNSILTDKLNLTLKEGEYIFFADGYLPNENDKKENVQLVFMYGVSIDEPKKESLTVNELIEKLQSLPEEMKDAEVDIFFEDKEGSGEGFPLNFVSSYEAVDDDEIPSHVSLTHSEFDERKSDQDRIKNIEDMCTPIETNTTDIGKVNVYELSGGKILVHILTCSYGGDKNIIKEIVDGEEI